MTPFIYFGVVTKVFAPDDKHNFSKYQYEYQVKVTMENYSQVPVSAITINSFGDKDNYEDVILKVGARVLIIFPRGDIGMGIILGTPRMSAAKVNKTLGAYYKKRFNKIEWNIDKSGNWSVKSDSGPQIQVNVGTIVISDAAGEQIILDKASKTLTINAKNWKVNVTGDAAINVTGKADIKAGKDVNVTAGGNANIKGKKVNLIGGGTGITTKTSHQGVIDLITGVPVTESKKIFGDV
jgi:hypothetical protein